MYIEKLHIDTFGKLSDVDIELDPGMNIIRGDNESGKSTLAAFIKFILYGISAKERETVMSWRTGGAAGSMTVNTGDKRYRIERALIANREAVQLIDSDTNMPIRHALDDTTPGELLLGVGADMFSSTAFVSQLGTSEVGGAKVSEGIENILFSADESVNTQKALTKLDNARAAILHKNEKGGRLYEIDGECAELEIRLADALRTHSAILEAQAKLSDAEAKLSVTEAKAEKLSSRIEQFETSTLLTLFQRAKKLESRISELRTQIELNNAVELDEVEALEKMRSRLAHLADELHALKEREAELVPSREDPALDEYIDLGGRCELEKKLTHSRRSSVSCAVIGAAAFIGGLTAATFGAFPMLSGGAPHLIPLIGGSVMAVAAIVLFIVAVVMRKRADNIEAYYDFDELDREIAERESQKEAQKAAELARTEAEAAYADACDEVRRVCGCEPDELDARISERNEKLRSSDGVKAEYDKHNSLLAQIRTQLEQYSEEELKAKYDPTIDTSDIDAANLPAMRREADFAKKAAESLEKLKSELEVTLAGLTPQAEDPTAINDRLTALNFERSELKKKHTAYKLAYDKLLEASESLRESVSPRLASDAAQLMTHITGGKYREMGVGADLSMSALTESGQKPLSVLSAGTKDAAYLCLRLALISLLYRQSAPPVIFDESFVRQDDTRLTNILKLIRIRDAQSMIFTSNNREENIMKQLGFCKVIEL